MVAIKVMIMVLILIVVMSTAIIIDKMVKAIFAIYSVTDRLGIIDTHIRTIMEMLDVMKDNKDNEILEVYKDAMDRVMAKNLGQYEMIKQHRESGEPFDQGGRVSSQADNLRKKMDKFKEDLKNRENRL